MKTTISKPVTKIEDVEEFCCDICKEPLKQRYVSTDGNEARIEAWFWPEYGDDDYEQHKSMWTLGFDCCYDCFVNKVKPTLEQHLGVSFRKEEL